MFGSLRRRFSRRPPTFEPGWHSLLRQRFRHWSSLTPTEVARMERLVADFVATTRWEAARGFRLTEEIKVLIAAQASLLLLGLDLDRYPDVTSVIVHPSTVRLHGAHPTGGGMFSSAPRMLAGQAHYQGPVVLSWSATRRGAEYPTAGHNVVYHEFAHRLDMLDGLTDGTPPLDDDETRRRWVEVFTAAYDRVRTEGSLVLRAYAGTNPAEFFAVATEVFFNRPHDLRTHEPALYGELRAFYGQDPATRWPADGP